jgi:hypothetical protein
VRKHLDTATFAEANAMNDFFCTAGKKVQEETASVPDYSTVHCPDTVFKLQPVSEADVAKAVKELPNWRAPGVDGINGFVLKAALPAVVHKIVALINASIQCASFPSCFRHAIVVPVPKTARASGPDEHRPVSLLMLLSKVFERVVYE